MMVLNQDEYLFDLNDLEQLGQGQPVVGNIFRTICPTPFIFATGGQLSKLFKSINFE